VPHQVELYLSCRKLKKKDSFHCIDPQVKVYRQNDKGAWVSAGQTEVVKDATNPNFSACVTTEFIFETHQYLRFEVVDTSYHPSYEVIGFVDITLGRIMGMKNQLALLNLQNKEGKEVGKIIIQGERTGHSTSKVIWQWSGVKLMNTDGWFDKSDPFLRFMKKRDNGDYLQVHESEIIMDNLNPIWKPFKIMDYKLCGADHHKTFKIECWDWEKDKNYQYIGACELTLDDLKNGKREFELRHPKHKKKTGTLKLLHFALQPQYSFIDYVRGGQQLKVMLGVDFTGSNKVPTDPNSLHSVNPQVGFNEYQKAISAVCQILQNYDIDQVFPMYGFGGIPHYPTMNMTNVSNCFPCTGNPQQPGALGLEGIMNTYLYSLQSVELSGPTYFSPLISEVMRYCQHQKNNPNGLYTVLLILTDGEIHDMEETINCLIEASHLPLSIIIVGIGNEDFTKMEILDGDQGLANSKGVKVQRDLVQFVPFRKFQGDMQKLAQNVLAEVPDQLIKYMELIGRKPNPPLSVEMDKVGYSQQVLRSLSTLDGESSAMQDHQSGPAFGSPGSFMETTPRTIMQNGSLDSIPLQSPYMASPNMINHGNPFNFNSPVMASSSNRQNYYSPPQENGFNHYMNNGYEPQENGMNNSSPYQNPALKTTMTLRRYDIESIAPFGGMLAPEQNHISLNAFGNNMNNSYQQGPPPNNMYPNLNPSNNGNFGKP